MEYNKKSMYGDRAKRAESCCKLGHPEGYYRMGKGYDEYHKMMKKGEKMNYHDMDGYKMAGKKHMGPTGYWGIPGMHGY